MYLQFKNFRNANEVLYVLDSARKMSNDPVSKLGLQKLLYLSACFAPIRDVILSFIRYTRWYRGPYSSGIQNTVDHLVGYGLVNVTGFKLLGGAASITNYKISDGGLLAVENLRQYSVEDDKAWWIDCITRLAFFYSKDDYLKKDEEFSGLDIIVRMVYQEETFKLMDSSKGKGAVLDFTVKENITKLIIQTIKEHVNQDKGFLELPEKTKAELILLAFFEQLYFNALDHTKNEQERG